MKQFCGSSSDGSHSYETDRTSLEGEAEDVHGDDVLSSLQTRVDVLDPTKEVESESEGELCGFLGEADRQR